MAVETRILFDGLDPDHQKNPFERSFFKVDNGKAVTLSWDVQPAFPFPVVFHVMRKDGSDIRDVVVDGRQLTIGSDNPTVTVAVPGYYCLKWPSTPVPPIDMLLAADTYSIEGLTHAHYGGSGGGASTAPIPPLQLDTQDQVAGASFTTWGSGVFQSPQTNSFPTMVSRSALTWEHLDCYSVWQSPVDPNELTRLYYENGAVSPSCYKAMRPVDSTSFPQAPHTKDMVAGFSCPYPVAFHSEVLGPQPRSLQLEGYGAWSDTRWRQFDVGAGHNLSVMQVGV